MNGSQAINKEERGEFPMKTRPGLPILIAVWILIAAAVGLFVLGILSAAREAAGAVTALCFIGCGVSLIAAIILGMGLKTIRPNEAAVFTLFGDYVGVIREAGLYWVNPFVSAISYERALSVDEMKTGKLKETNSEIPASLTKKTNRISLKTQTLDNGKQKINDELGNPIEIGVAVIWQVTDTYKAVFRVDDYREYLSIQTDAALRNIVRMYPYDLSGNDNADNEKTLRGSSQEIADNLRDELQQKVDIAGITILEARITHLAYAPEIAAVMLQRQQASAIIDARQMIVEGAVGMVDMALKKLAEEAIVDLDDERKAQMVSNLLVVLCGNRDAQPIVNSGSIY